MNALILFSLTPFITAAIGWLTNWVAIKMLFRPLKPIKILFWKWQGLIPRRHLQLAGEAAEMIEREILQQHTIQEEIRKIDLEPHLDEAAHHLVWDRIGPQLQAIPLLGSFVNDSTLARFEAIARAEMKKEASPLMDKVATEFENSVNLKEMIEGKIAELELERLEAIVTEVAKREFRTIEILGAVLGFIIGLVQITLFYFSGSIQFN